MHHRYTGNEDTMIRQSNPYLPKHFGDSKCRLFIVLMMVSCLNILVSYALASVFLPCVSNAGQESTTSHLRSSERIVSAVDVNELSVTDQATENSTLASLPEHEKLHDQNSKHVDDNINKTVNQILPEISSSIATIAKVKIEPLVNATLEVINNSTTTTTTATATATTRVEPLINKYALEAKTEDLVYKSDPNTTLAACHKPLFGDVDMYKVIMWASYNRMLGFDKIFIWYMPHVETYPGFEELSNLPFVIMIPTPDGNLTVMEYGAIGVDLSGPASQKRMLYKCVKHVAKDYTWVMHADYDELLWFDDTRYESLRHLLFSNQHLNYLSFGKYMYSMNYTVDTDPSEVYTGLEKYAFTPKSYCEYFHRISKRKPGSDFCPTHRGRAKLFIRPGQHRNMPIHGEFNFVDEKETDSMKHFKTSEAHFKEWPLLSQENKIKVLKKDKIGFFAPNTLNLGIHGEDRAQQNADRTISMHFDTGLADWTRKVATNNYQRKIYEEVLVNTQ